MRHSKRSQSQEDMDEEALLLQARLQIPHPFFNLQQDVCSGAAELPSSDDLCYTGSFLVEKFFVKMTKQTATSGTVDLQDSCLQADAASFLVCAAHQLIQDVSEATEAVGPKTTTCNGAHFQQSGSDITVEDTTNCGLVPGTDYTVKYCSTQDEIVVHMLKPMDVSVVLSRTPCAEAQPNMQARWALA